MLQVRRLLWLWLFCSSVSAEGLVINQPQVNVPVMPQASLYFDDDAGLTIADVLRPALAQQFIHNNTGRTAFGYRKEALWIRIPLHNASGQDLSLRLNINSSRHAITEFFVVKQQRVVSSIRTGADYPYTQRPIDHPAFVFPFSLKSGEQVTLYVQVFTSGSLVVPLTLQDSETFGTSARDTIAFWSLFYGVMLGLLAYNILQFFSTRDRTQLWYILLCFCCILINAGLDGTMYWIWPDWPAWQARAPYLFALIGNAAALRFSQAFLQLEKAQFPRWDLFLRFWFWLQLPLLIWNLWSDAVLQHAIAVYTTLTTALLLSVLGIYRLLQQARSARFFCVAWALFLLSVLASSSSTLGWLNVGAYALSTYKLGTATQMIFLALAVADYYNEWRKRGEEAARTAHLAMARSQAKSEFLARMSHELRTPAHGILGMTELLRQGVSSSEQQSLLSTLSSSAQTLARLVSDILDYAKIEAGKLTLNSEEFAIRDMLRHTLTPLALQAQQRQIDLSVYLGKEVPEQLTGDATRLGQILTNLVGNALKFTEHGFVRIKILLVDQTAETWRIRIEVSDSGLGISEYERERIFAPFEQAMESGRLGGTGLGLAITKQLAELMNGLVGVESESGRGSRFWCEVQLRHAPISSPQTQQSSKRIVLLADGLRRAQLIVQQHRDPQVQIDLLETWPKNTAVLKSYQWIIVWPEHVSWLSAEEDAHLRQRLLVIREYPSQTFASNWHCIALPWLYADFTLHLPKTESSQAVSAALTGSRILVVEDNHTNQLVVQGMLNRFGYKADLASNGKEAMRLIVENEHPYHLVVTDIEMPEMDGIATAQAIREWEKQRKRPSCTIVALTAHATREFEHRCRTAGMNDFLAKPFTMDALRQMLERYATKEETSED